MTCSCTAQFTSLFFFFEQESFFFFSLFRWPLKGVHQHFTQLQQSLPLLRLAEFKREKSQHFLLIRRSGSHLFPSWCGMHTWRCLLSGSSNPYNNAGWHLLPSGALKAGCSDRRWIVSTDQCGCDALDPFIVTFIFNPFFFFITDTIESPQGFIWSESF